MKRELEEGMKGELARLGDDHKTELNLIKDIPVSRLDDRLALLKNIDRFNRTLDSSGSMDHRMIDKAGLCGVSHAPCSTLVALEEAERGVPVYDFTRVETQTGMSLVDVTDAGLDLLVGDVDLVRRTSVRPVPISQDRVISPR